MSDRSRLIFKNAEETSEIEIKNSKNLLLKNAFIKKRIFSKTVSFLENKSRDQIYLNKKYKKSHQKISLEP